MKYFATRSDLKKHKETEHKQDIKTFVQQKTESKTTVVRNDGEVEVTEKGMFTEIV